MKDLQVKLITNKKTYMLKNPVSVWVSYRYMLGMGVYGYCLYYEDDTYKRNLIYWSDYRTGPVKDAKKINDAINSAWEEGKERLIIDIRG